MLFIYMHRPHIKSFPSIYTLLLTAVTIITPIIVLGPEGVVGTTQRYKT